MQRILTIILIVLGCSQICINDNNVQATQQMTEAAKLQTKVLIEQQRPIENMERSLKGDAPIRLIRETEPSRSGINRKTVEITAYTAGYESTGKNPGDAGYGLTASGYQLTDADAWKVVAADPVYYPVGTKIYIDGVGMVTVRDTGSIVKGPNKLDIFVGMRNVNDAYAWGRQSVVIGVVR